MEELERLFQANHGQGLPLCAALSDLLSESFPGLKCNLIGNGPKVNLDTSLWNGAAHKNAVLRIRVGNAGRDGNIDVRIPCMRTVKVPIRSSEDNEICVTECFVHLSGLYQASLATYTSASVSQNLSTAEEVRILTQMCTTVIEKLCSSMTFESYETFVASVAEVIMRTVDFPSASIRSCKVRVDAAFQLASSPGDFRTIAEASWRRGLQEPLTENEVNRTRAKLSLETRNGPGLRRECVDASIKREAEQPEPPMQAATPAKIDDSSVHDGRDKPLTEKNSAIALNSNIAPQDVVRRRAYVGLGSNLGDRLANIESACRIMDEDPNIRITRTSALYETDPMYVENQDRFLNGVCQVSEFAVHHCVIP